MINHPLTWTRQQYGPTQVFWTRDVGYLLEAVIAECFGSVRWSLFDRSGQRSLVSGPADSIEDGQRKALIAQARDESRKPSHVYTGRDLQRFVNGYLDGYDQYRHEHMEIFR